jgi:penicillin amidase
MWRKILIGALMLIIILLTGAWIFLKQSHAPKYEGQLLVKGLQSEVTVTFDRVGIPHIEASSAEDAYIALGYIHAQDRLFQMDLMRRVGGGRLAELLGKDLVETDKFFRTLGIPQHATLSADYFFESSKDSPWLPLVNAYIEGINLFIDQGNIPIEYRLLGSKPKKFDIVNLHEIVGYMSFTFAMALKSEPVATYIQRNLGPEYVEVLAIEPRDYHTKIPSSVSEDQGGSFDLGIHQIMKSLPIAPFIGSNAWVLSPEKSESGQVVFCNDTHIGFSQPSVWYEVHLSYPDYDFYGNHLAGVPFPLIGHSQNHAYGLTMFENDDFDLYEEIWKDDLKKQILYKDGWQQISERIDTIPIKGGQYELLTIQSTPRGNLIQEVLPELTKITDNPVSAWWVFLKEPSRALEALYKINTATDPTSFQDGVSLIHAPGLNVMYGDRAGNIGWWAAAKLPIRPEGVSSKFLHNASTGEDEPLGWWPFSANPKSINPPSGYVYSANNMPDTTAQGLVIPGYYYPGDRAKAIMDVLNENKKFSVEDMKSMQLQHQNSRHSKISHHVSQRLITLFPEDDYILTHLNLWDGGHGSEQIGPVIYHQLMYFIMIYMMEDEIGLDMAHAFQKTFLCTRSLEEMIHSDTSPWWDDKTTSSIESKDDILKKAYLKTKSSLVSQLGKDPVAWLWKRVISVEHKHALGAKKPLNKLFNVGPLYIDGNKEALNKLDFTWNETGQYEVNSGPAMRIILDFEDINGSLSVLPTGQSGNVYSPHYKDQARMFASGQYRGQWMSMDSVKAYNHTILVLHP